MNIKKGFLGMLLVMFFNAYLVANEKIKLYACYSPSHALFFFEYFLPSLKDNFDVVIATFPQECKDPAFMKEGWTKTTLRKARFIVNAIRENWGKVIIYSDVDIIFFRSIESDIVERLQGKDMVIQKDVHKYEGGTGFFACHCNANTLKVWEKVCSIMESDVQKSDQRSFNEALKYFPEFSLGYLPQEYAHASMLTGNWYAPEDEIFIPEHAFLFHGNYANGMYLKTHQLTRVKSYAASRDKQ